MAILFHVRVTTDSYLAAYFYHFLITVQRSHKRQFLSTHALGCLFSFQYGGFYVILSQNMSFTAFCSTYVCVDSLISLQTSNLRPESSEEIVAIMGS